MQRQYYFFSTRTVIGCITFFATTVFSGSLGSTTDRSDAHIDRLWETTVKPVLRGDATLPLINRPRPYSLKDFSPISAYYYQMTAMWFVRAAYRWQKKSWQADVEAGLEVLRGQLQSLQELRRLHGEGKLEIDPYYLDVTRSGPSEKRLFSFRDEKPGSRKLVSSDIVEKQITAYVSFALGEIVEQPVSKEQTKLLLDLTDYLVNDFLWMHATELNGMHYTKDYPSLMSRLKAKLERPLPPEMVGKRYYSGIMDAEWWMFFVAANTLRVVEQLKLEPRYGTEKVTMIKRYLELAYSSFDQRLEKNEWFDYDLGGWSDHPSLSHSDYTTLAFPGLLPPRIDPQASWDSSHFDRMPWVLEALARSEKATNAYYANLKKRLGHHFIARTLHFDAGRPLMRNYISGKDAWYGVSSTKGYAPGALSLQFIFGSWATLAKEEPKISEAYQALLGLVLARSDKDIAFRTKHYGRILSPPETSSSFGSVDESGPDSIAETRLRILLKLIAH